MLLRACAFLADENIHPEVLAFLRSEGLNVTSIVERGLSGTPDIAVLHLARDEQRVILTHDSDFGTMRALLDRDLTVHPPFIVVAHRADDQIRIRVRQL